MPRALVVVLDSVGIGGAPDAAAAAFGDEGADTLGNIARAAAEGRADRESLRTGPLRLPNLARLGLGAAAGAATGRPPPGLDAGEPQASWGHGVEVARGKDTITGHWEIAGAPPARDWGYFPRHEPAFPASLVAALVEQAGLAGLLGNRHASGTAILDELGAEHVRTGKPIAYTSADSVFQIAAHEEAFELERLYATCRIARELCDPLRIARVIARPFAGDAVSGFRRTANRRDFAMPPEAPSLLDRVGEAGGRVFAVGKVADIFAGRGVDTHVKAEGNVALLDAALAAFRAAEPGDLVFVNLVDFDQLYGHRRDVAGYAAALEAFDRRVPEIEAALGLGDMAVITADHGNDPTFSGTDHTREQVPILALRPGAQARRLGRRDTFADIGQSLAAHLGLVPLEAGTSWLDEETRS